MKGKLFMKGLLAVSGVLAVVYLYYTVFPGPVGDESLKVFSLRQVELGREYNRSVRIAYILGFLLQVAVLSWLLFSDGGQGVSGWVRRASNSRTVQIGLFFLITWTLLKAVALPVSLYQSYFLQHQWGFSNQDLISWGKDYLLGSGLELLISMVGVMLLFYIMDKQPVFWWVTVTVLLSGWLVVQAFLWPVLISPLFNKFEPVGNERIAKMVEQLSLEADVTVNEVLVMDASQRTTKANAYFAGVGKTRRIVLFDNLLNNYTLEEIQAVIAHEIGHWKLGHISRGLIYGAAANALLWLLIFIVLRSWFRSGSGFNGYPVQALAVIILMSLLVAFLISPVQNGISRKMEFQADAYSIKLMGSSVGTVSLLKRLAIRDAADVSPPPFIEWFAYSHPAIVKRINEAKKLTHGY